MINTILAVLKLIPGFQKLEGYKQDIGASAFILYFIIMVLIPKVSAMIGHPVTIHVPADVQTYYIAFFTTWLGIAFADRQTRLKAKLLDIQAQLTQDTKDVCDIITGKDQATK